MPLARIMGDMIMLPNGNVLIINGASAGVAGWEIGRNPVLNPVLYLPDDKIGSRFESQNPATIPRMYHSTAVLLRDGRVLVGGSNPHKRYNFTGVFFPTELSLEAFSPAYLDPENSALRPKIVLPASQTQLKYKQKLEVRFRVAAGNVTPDKLSVKMVVPSFTTHSFSMNQRLLVLGSEKVAGLGKDTYTVQVTTPGSGCDVLKLDNGFVDKRWFQWIEKGNDIWVKVRSRRQSYEDIYKLNYSPRAGSHQLKNIEEGKQHHVRCGKRRPSHQCSLNGKLVLDKRTEVLRKSFKEVNSSSSSDSSLEDGAKTGLLSDDEPHSGDRLHLELSGSIKSKEESSSGSLEEVRNEKIWPLREGKDSNNERGNVNSGQMDAIETEGQVEKDLSEGWILEDEIAKVIELKKDLWDFILFLQHIFTAPWCVGGNFNMVLSLSERIGVSVNLGSIRSFKSFIVQANIIDIPLHGMSYTLSNNRERETWARLDSFLLSPIILLWYNQTLEVKFKVASTVALDKLSLTMVAPSFMTHSFSMNHKLLVLGSEKVFGKENDTYAIQVTTPGSRNLAPLGYYLLFLVHQDIPSEGIWVNLQ
ncbi:hypothetical protein Ddye_007198 [Dipteronia dyeriana]|uniref:Galactose oxidase-like Early set domain-containing protein n=1 Tax=Dipteronia dyeriana TaxID=168575 RepID=A0AAD9XJY4_9ROSI|nr:hypothetical protein Ddye_007198 [Dipteronia dyeriana]